METEIGEADDRKELEDKLIATTIRRSKHNANGEDDATLADLDATLLRCLDSVDRLLLLRAALSETLAQGWIEMTRARYAMGPSRVGQTLFSLKPNAALVSVCATQELEQHTAYEYGENRLHHVTDEIEKRNHVCFKSIVEQDRNPKMEPMISFGTLVSPHLWSVQSSFQTALENLVEMANAQSIILCTYDQVLRLQKAATKLL